MQNQNPIPYSTSPNNPPPYNTQPLKSGRGCGCFGGCLMGCFAFFLLITAGLVFLYFTVDFKGMIKNQFTSPDTVVWIYKTAKSLDLLDPFLPENLSDGEKLKIIDELDRVMACYPKLPQNDRNLIIELAKTENTQNLNAEQIQALLGKIQAECGLTFEELQNLSGKLK